MAGCIVSRRRTKRPRGGTSIGGNLRTLWEFRHLIASGGVSYPESDVTKCGGVIRLLKIAPLPEAFRPPLIRHRDWVALQSIRIA
ncbi:MAG: hypothetical protein JOZ05_21775 [Acetobacteraceae bacterium]|nr:hypothetical protein [Acetobacteraceae bacterium]